MRRIFSRSSSFSMVISPTLPFRREISSSRRSRSRSFKADPTPSKARSCHAESGLGAVKFKLEPTTRIDPQPSPVRVTHWARHSHRL